MLLVSRASRCEYRQRVICGVAIAVVNLYELPVFILCGAGFDQFIIISKIHLSIVSMWFRTQSSLRGCNDVRLTIPHDSVFFWACLVCQANKHSRCLDFPDLLICQETPIVHDIDDISRNFHDVLIYFPWMRFVRHDLCPSQQDGAELQQSYDCSAGRAGNRIDVKRI